MKENSVELLVGWSNTEDLLQSELVCLGQLMNELWHIVSIDS